MTIMLADSLIRYRRHIGMLMFSRVGRFRLNNGKIGVHLFPQRILKNNFISSGKQNIIMEKNLVSLYWNFISRKIFLFTILQHPIHFLPALKCLSQWNVNFIYQIPLHIVFPNISISSSCEFISLLLKIFSSLLDLPFKVPYSKEISTPIELYLTMSFIFSLCKYFKTCEVPLMWL